MALISDPPPPQSFHFAEGEKGKAATRVVKMSAEKTVIHNPHPGTNTKVRSKM